VPFAADLLGLVRLAVALVFPAALARAAAATDGSPTPLALFAVAAATDFFDGIVARRAGPTRHGAVLDTVADVAFVLAGTVGGAALGLLPWAAPAAVALAVASYVAASVSRSARRGRWGLARSRVGHAAGVANYALVGLAAGSVAIPGAAWPWLLRLGSLATVALNLGAVLDRLVPQRARPRPRRARAPHGAGRGAR
jgi:phosphatidylglycerophosphate synthase